MREGRVEELYERLKEKAVNFQFKPGERINEVALASDLDASRTPLREALNRLVAEQFFAFRPGRGFFCRELDAPSVFALYEARGILESANVRLACARADDDDIRSLKEGALAASNQYRGKSIVAVTRDDETFHVTIAQLTGNAELVRATPEHQRENPLRALDRHVRACSRNQGRASADSPSDGATRAEKPPISCSHIAKAWIRSSPSLRRDTPIFFFPTRTRSSNAQSS